MVDNVSSKLERAGDKVANILHKELPPKDSCKTRVNFELRYGINAFFCFLLSFILAFSANALITLPKAIKLLLMLAPSFNRLPMASVLLARSVEEKKINIKRRKKKSVKKCTKV